MNFARITFTIAGIFGLIAILPCYFLERHIGEQRPPAITHPEFFYGFLGTALAWQILFLIISKRPDRYIAIIPAACVEKFAFGILAVILFVQNRLSPFLFAAGLVDLIFGVLFVVCFIKLKKHSVASY